MLHLVLLSQLNRTSSDKEANHKSHESLPLDSSTSSKQDDIQMRKDREWMMNKLNQTVIMDTSGEFYMIPFFSRAQALSHRDYTRQDISLVTQGSLAHLDNLPFMSTRWNGLLSVGLFVQIKEIEIAMDLIVLLNKCYPSIRKYISFHLVFPLQSTEKYPQLHTKTRHQVSKKWLSKTVATLDECNVSQSTDDQVKDNSTEDCYLSLLARVFTSVKSKSMNYFNVERIAYPNNLLRNVGRRYCLCEFILVIDIDMVTSLNLRDSFVTFAREGKLFENTLKVDKVAYVLPVYEVHRDMSESEIPGDKNSLLDMITIGKARQFYIEVCKKCQKYTEYETWEKEGMNDKLAIHYQVTWKDPWEPFYISRNTAPMYDERFRQYGFNRISNVCELHVALYHFYILNDAFVIHRGLKKSHSFHSDKQLDQERNRHLFRQFKLGLTFKYPHSDRSC